MKAYRITSHFITEDAVCFAENAGKARYHAFLSAKDAGFTVTFADLQVRRWPELDDADVGNPMIKPRGCWRADLVKYTSKPKVSSSEKI